MVILEFKLLQVSLTFGNDQRSNNSSVQNNKTNLLLTSTKITITSEVEQGKNAYLYRRPRQKQANKYKWWKHAPSLKTFVKTKSFNKFISQDSERFSLYWPLANRYQCPSNSEWVGRPETIISTSRTFTKIVISVAC